MPTDYEGVNVRSLTDDERYISTTHKELPLVIEPKCASDHAFLHDFLQSNSSSILKDVANLGAVLLRGFEISTDKGFERSVLSIRGLRGMADAFMSEAGRTLVEGTEFVLHTNSIYKTGGTLAFGGFHTENYYSPDVPKFICFYCSTAPKLGGETGMVHMPSVYKDLDDSIKKRLEGQPYRTVSWPLKAVAERYTMSVDRMAGFCKDAGLPVELNGEHSLIHLFKPSLFEHPTMKETTLALNLKIIPGQAAALEARFEMDYAGERWADWRLARRDPLLVDLSRSYNPAKTLEEYKQRKPKAFGQQPITVQPSDKVGSLFTPTSVDSLVESMRKHFASFAWKRGDILLLDNLQIAHAGMPGLGDRLIRAMVCNPITMSYAANASGICRYQDADEAHGTVHSRLLNSRQA